MPEPITEKTVAKSINSRNRTKRNKPRPQNYTQNIVYFIFFLLITAFSCFLLVHLIRSFEIEIEQPKTVIPLPPPPTPIPQIIHVAHPLRFESQAIWKAIDNKNFRKLDDLLKTASPLSLYSYEYDLDDEHKTHLYDRILGRKCIDSFRALLNSKLFDINHHTLLHKTIKHFDSNAEPIQTQFYDALLESGVDIEYVSGEGLTPLAVAVKYSNLTALRFLIKHNVIINRPLPEYDSILHYFTDKIVQYPLSLPSESRAVLVALIKAGANAFHRGKDGCTAFHHAILVNTNSEVIKTFIDTIPDVLYYSFKYRSALLNYPVSPEKVENPSESSLYSYTPLHLAVHRRSPHLIKLFYGRGGSLKIKDNAGLTAWDHAQILKDPTLIDAFNRTSWIYWALSLIYNYLIKR